MEDLWPKKKVCIVDDDPDLREIYMRKFHQEGFDVVLAADGAMGIQIIRREKPDVVLLDLHMPVKTGIEVLQEIHEDPELKTIPIVVLTNIDNEDAFKEVGKFDTRFYLVKSLTTPQKAVDYVREIL
jgi:CheY-like chemotaxis protein